MNHNNDWQEYRSGFNSEEERFEPKRDDFERPRNIYREQRTVVQRDHSSCLVNGIRAFFIFLLSVFALICMAAVIYVCVNGFPNEQDDIGNGETLYSKTHHNPHVYPFHLLLEIHQYGYFLLANPYESLPKM